MRIELQIPTEVETQHVDILDEQVIGRDLRDISAGETDGQDATFGIGTSQGSAKLIATDRVIYDISAAKRDLGYEPSVSLDRGMALLADSLAGSDPDAPANSPANEGRHD